jgi:hypothetical protein
MRFKLLHALAAIVPLSACTPSSAPSVEQGQGGLYAYHTGPVVGGCPGLDWHITLGPDGSLVGFVAWDQGQHIARLKGALHPDRNFEMNAQEVGGAGRTASVKGRAAGSYINAVINGSGTPCDGDYLNIPRVVGGLSGGGG